MSKNLKILIAVFLALFVAAPAMAAKFAIHGDLDNRFMIYTNQIKWFGGDSGSQSLDDDDTSDSFGEIKYRIWTEMASDDGTVKGVYGIEVGGIKFGDSANGGGFSGDGKNVETRWAYTDFQLPGVASKARFQMGLFTNTVNKFFWSETIMGVKFYTDSWYLAWLRGASKLTGTGEDWGDGDLDSINARYDMKMDAAKIGFFGSYLFETSSGTYADFSGYNPLGKAPGYQIKTFPEAEFSLFAIGIDGSWSSSSDSGKLFVNWDLIYENGSIDKVSFDDGVTTADVDISGYLLHADVGFNFGKSTITFTSYYASGQDPNDTSNDSDAFISVDTDANYSIIFQEGGYTNDNYFTERHYIGEAGMWLNKLALDYKVNEQTTVGIAGLYLMTAEDLQWSVGTSTFNESDLGFEVDAYVKHKIYSNLEFALNVGYLMSGDAMDYFETAKTRNGSSDVDPFACTAHVRYQF